MADIKNYQFYNSEMRKVILDKLFFLPHVDATYFLDYGCADGALLKQIDRMFPGEYFLMGYDIDQKMIDLAKENLPSGAGFSTNWDVLVTDMKELQKKGEKTCLILNSLIHEIYAYQFGTTITSFWNRVFNSGFDYIVIRDMGMFSESLRLGEVEFNEATYAKVLGRADATQVYDFQKIYGPIKNSPKNLVHFLLKYRYVDNWDREVNENYFSVTLAHILKVIAKKVQYKQVSFEHFSVPFIRRQIQNDFDIVMDIPTHYKLILEKR